jgi:G:T-mismatch repair DNA endonuclease (very short patch repair protein)
VKNPDRPGPRAEARRRAKVRRAVDRAIAWHKAAKTSKATRVTGVPGRSHNRLEARLAAMMDSWGIDYQWQFRLGRYVYDFKTKDRCLVEVHGTWWHADPRFHPVETLTPDQRRNVLHDLDKKRHAARQGYRLKVVWEHDIDKGLVKPEDVGA